LEAGCEQPHMSTHKASSAAYLPLSTRFVLIGMTPKQHLSWLTNYQPVQAYLLKPSGIRAYSKFKKLE
jgi:hypothetical protein